MASNALVGYLWYLVALHNIAKLRIESKTRVYCV